MPSTQLLTAAAIYHKSFVLLSILNKATCKGKQQEFPLEVPPLMRQQGNSSLPPHPRQTMLPGIPGLMTAVSF